MRASCATAYSQRTAPGGMVAPNGQQAAAVGGHRRCACRQRPAWRRFQRSPATEG